MPGRDLDLSSNSSAMTRRLSFARHLSVLLLGLLILLAMWAGFFHLAMVIRAEGRVIPSAKSQVIQHLEGGVVLSLDVMEGDLVKKGAVLARISDVAGKSQVGERRVRSDALLAKIARLNAEAANASQLTLPAGQTIEPAVWQSELAAFAARGQRLAQDVRTAHEQINQKQAELAEQKIRRTSLLAEAELAQRQWQISADMLARDSTSKMEHLDAQARLQRLRTMIGDSEAAVPRINASIAEAKNRALEIESRFRAEAQTELTSARTDLGRIEEELKAGSDRMDRTDLRAPVSGVINRISINTIGGVIKPGEAVMEITPMDGKIVVEAKVRPSDRAELHPGLPAHVRLSAYDYASYGSAEGILTEVSADTVPDERGERYYRVRVSLDSKRAAFAGREIVPGMAATAEIVVGRRSVLQYLTSPLRRFARTALSEPH